MSRPNPTYTRDEILAAFIKAHESSTGRESRIMNHFDAYWAFGFLLGHFGIGADFRATVTELRALAAPERDEVAPVIDIRTRERIA